MKNRRVLASIVLGLCAFSAAQAQNKWTYKGNNGAKGTSDEQTITIVVTQRPNSYDVRGEYSQYIGLGKSAELKTCKVRGSYFPKTSALKARCIFDNGDEVNITGFKKNGKDELQLDVDGYQFVVRRLAAKPTLNRESSSALDSFNLTGAWICTKNCPAGGEGKTASITQTGRNLTFTNEGGGTSAGKFEDDSTVVATEWGNLKASIGNAGKELHWSNGTIWVKQ